MELLSLDKVSYSYDHKRQVVKQITASFEAGKIYVIMGKSGAGKSTVLSLLSGLEVCQKGQINYNGNNLATINRNEYRRKDIGIIFQGYNLMSNATAIDNVLLSMDICGKKIVNKKSKAFELLEKVGIDHQKANRKVLKLSGGEQQRVAIAVALATEPALILADEPTGNLDGETERSIMELLLTLAKEDGKCIIVVTHSNVVSKYADELWGLNRGRLNLIKKQNYE